MIRSARSVSSNGSAASDGPLRQGTRAEILRNFSTLSPGLIAFPLLHFSGFVPGRMPGSSHSVAFFQLLKACPCGTFSGLGRGGFPSSARFPGSLQSASIPIIFELYRRPPRAREMRLSSQDGFSRSTWWAGSGGRFFSMQRPSVLQLTRFRLPSAGRFAPKVPQDRAPRDLRS